VLIFPEGEVNNSEDGAMAPFQPGVGLLAQSVRLPIVPMRLDGVWGMKRERRRLAHMGEVTVRIGKPVSVPDEMAAEEIARHLQRTVAEL
ncbi:MAG TPA: lysophospholipid acyltransferase family protein, partial [Candidatus Acidoferrum sp.]|nr:lysophospholipid acyltransferase family protein [Candidatus Acidoferrum sp.]